MEEKGTAVAEEVSFGIFWHLDVRDFSRNFSNSCGNNLTTLFHYGMLIILRQGKVILEAKEALERARVVHSVLSPRPRHKRRLKLKCVAVICYFVCIKLILKCNLK